MPARNSSMELSSPEQDANQRATRRKSGRVVKKPEHLAASSPAPSTKRKRGEAEAGGAEDVDMEDASEESSEESEGEPDEEELKEKKKKRARKASKPAAKRVKQTNGDGMTLAIRPAKGGKRKRPQHGQTADAEAAGGLYAEVFARDQSLDDAAAGWLAKFNESEAEAMADLFNFTLKCAGCDSKINGYDVEDPDHFTEKISDIQEEYQAQGISEYPLINKGKGANAFRDSFAGLFRSLVATMAKSNLLFTNEPFTEVLNAWLSTMASASNRPLRHTATVASLAITTALCEIGHDTLDVQAKTLRQAEGEKKKGRVNKGRVSGLEDKVRQAQTQKEQIDNFITTWFDTVFIHRYRDVDPKIRDECVKALGEWVILFPDHFFEGAFLRYLGWVLSDTNKETRHEVVRALIRLYKMNDKLSGLRTFTERFRPRIVEMASRDSDLGVRADALLLLDLLREAGFLEPDDIDSVGRLIFDSEIKVRKAVVPFFAATIDESYEAKIDELGGQEGLDEVLPDADDDFDLPSIEWLKLKCVAENLQAYDAYDEIELDGAVQVVHGSTNADSLILVPERLESRFSLAAEALYDHIDELQDWEVLSGYLLYDHSQTPDELNGVEPDAVIAFKQAFKLDEREEILLLEVLNASVKLKLTNAVEAASDKKTKKTKAQKQEAQELQETAARHLAQLIPRLLNKFGAIPDAASAVLRLQHVLNLEIFQELRQDLTTYSALLDDIKKQFVSHGKPQVLQEASVALLHAKSYEDLEEVTEGKLQALWEDTVNSFHALCKDHDLTTRGNLRGNVLTTLENTVLRISNLSKISDPTEHLEALPVATRKKSKAKVQQEQQDSGIQSMIAIIQRGIPSPDLDAETDAQEDALALQAVLVANFYFMWKVKSFKDMIEGAGHVPFNILEPVAELRDNYVRSLTDVLLKRRGADELRLAFAGYMIDLFCMFAGLAHVKPKGKTAQQQPPQSHEGEEDVDKEAHLVLALEVPQKTQLLLLQILSATEKAFAKRTKRRLEEDVDDEPMDTDEEPEDPEDEDEAEESQTDEKKLMQTLMAEKRLCEYAGKLCMGIWAGVLDGKTEGAFQQNDEEEEADKKKQGAVEWRLKRNHKTLGPNFKALVDQYDAMKPGATKKNRKAAAKAKAKVAESSKSKSAPKSKEIVIEDDDDDEIEDVDDDVRREEELRAEEEAANDEAQEEELGPEKGTEEVESVLGD